MKTPISFDPSQKAEVSAELDKKILSAMRSVVSPDPKYLFFKYTSLFIFSTFISLIFCPQKGFSLSGFNLDLVHHLFHQSEILCGIFCGSVFFISTHFLSFMLLSHFERLTIVRKFSVFPLIAFSAFFGFSMTSIFSSVDAPLIYNLSWAGAVLGLYYLFTKFFIYNYKIKF